MSGEAIAIPVVPIIAIAAIPVVVAGVGVGLVMYGAAKGIKAVVDAQAEQARLRAEAEKLRLAEWQRFMDHQQQAMESSRKSFEASRQLQIQLLQTPLDAPPSIRESDSLTGERRRLGRTHRKDSDKLATEAIDKLAALFETIPNTLLDDPKAPFRRLMEQLRNWQRDGNVRNIESLSSFKKTIERTAVAYQEKLADEERRLSELGRRLDQLMDRVLFLSQLESSFSSELAVIRTAILSAADSRSIRIGVIETIESRLADIESEALKKLSLFATRTALAEATLRNFNEIGYEVAVAFPDKLDHAQAHAVLLAPHGGQVRVTIQSNAEVAFRLLHERYEGDGPLSDHEYRNYRAMERQFCSHLSSVTERLHEEGFEIDLHHQPDIPRDKIEIATAVFFDEPDDDLHEKHKKSLPENRRHISKK
jgi:hypothetical protein